MRENTYTTYTCEICQHPWSLKESCEKCEALGYPENYDKLLGKWIVVPTSVYFSNKQAEDSFNFVPEKKWRVVRIDANYITNLQANLPWPTGVSATGTTTGDEPIDTSEFEKRYVDQILKLNHRLVVTCKGFEDNSRVESLKEYFEVPEAIWEELNTKLVEMEKARQKDKEKAEETFKGIITRYVTNFFTSEEFEQSQHIMAEEALESVIKIAGIELPVIKQEELPAITIQAN